MCSYKTEEQGKNTMNYQMIVLDLDGTLTNKEKVITSKTKEALFELKGQGGIIVLASGRPTYGVMPLAKELELDRTGGMFCPLTEEESLTVRVGRPFLPKSFLRNLIGASLDWQRSME